MFVGEVFHPLPRPSSVKGEGRWNLCPRGAWARSAGFYVGERLACRSELARDPGVELRLNQVTVMGRIAVWGREGYAFISNFR